MPLPLLKLAFLFCKQMTKPVATYLKVRARDNPRFRELILKPADWYHRKVTRKEPGRTTKKHINPEAAISLASDAVGEFFFYCVCAGLVYAEYRSSSQKSEMEKEHMKSLENKIDELSLQNAVIEAEFRELQRRLGQVETGVKDTKQKR